MKLSIIAAIGKNNELGLNNNLIWHLPGDMKFFKETTIGHTIIMGRKTFESLPRLLPDRKHIVLSKSNIDIPKVEVYRSIPDFMSKYQNSDEEIFNIGGASIYQALLQYTDEMYLTEIEATAKADAYFPHFNKKEFTCQILDEQTDKKTNIKYKHVLYKRTSGKSQ